MSPWQNLKDAAAMIAVLVEMAAIIGLESACTTINYWQLQTLTMPTSGGTTSGTAGGDNVVQANTFRCVKNYTGPVYTKQIAWSGMGCANKPSGCAYYRYENTPLPDKARFDQRGVEGYQVTFPVLKHLHAMFRFVDQNNTDLCLAGGAVIGRNPLAMVWLGEEGTKTRKNNFITGGGSNRSIVVEGVRVHNNHDPMVASNTELRDSWFTWNRDDLFESRLNVQIRDTLIDGTYTFLSAPDSCADGNLTNNKIIIENSLIRLQKMSGGSPNQGETGFNSWDWTISGRFNGLWKANKQCGKWPGMPKVELRNNIFLIEGRPGATSGLPSEDTPDLPNLVACENNVFLYYSDERPQATTPKPGGRFYNPNNPNFTPNGKDCFQRVMNREQAWRIWEEARAKWIARHTGSSNPRENVMMIAGVDYPVFSENQNLQIRNKATNQCIGRGANGADVLLAPCNGSDAQLWNSQAFSDGKLRGAILLRNKSTGGYLRTQDQEAIAGDGHDNDFDPDVFWTNVSTPDFIERWYIYPLGNEPGGEVGTYAIESDALRRSYMLAKGSKLQVQLFYQNGESTPLPQAHLPSGDDARLQWYIEPR